MKRTFLPSGRVFMLGALLGLSGLVWGHGDEVHADTPMTTGAGQARVEAHTEAFELVGQLDKQELTLLIDRYDSNEPVLGAKVTVESGGIEAAATFHADHGDYAVSDERLLALLRQPGEHALVFTITLGAESDLLDGTLHHPVAVAPPEHGEGLRWAYLPAAGLLLTLAAAGVFFMQRRARTRGLPQLGAPT